MHLSIVNSIVVNCGKNKAQPRIGFLLEIEADYNVDKFTLKTIN